MSLLFNYDLAHLQEIARLSGYNVCEWSKRLGVSCRQLERHVKKVFNQTPRNWLRDEQLRNAPQLLEQKHSVKEVAGCLGFKQLSHFSRVFKSQFGVSPRTYLSLIHSHLDLATIGDTCKHIRTPQNVLTFNKNIERS